MDIIFWIWFITNAVAATSIVREAYSVDDSCACLILPVWKMRLKARVKGWLVWPLYVLAVLFFLPFLVFYYLWMVVTFLIVLIFCGK